MTAKTLGLVLLTVLSVLVALSAIVVDFTPTHLYNPTWPPHAQFHGYLSVARTVLIMGAIVVLAWGPVRAGMRFGWTVLTFLLLGWLVIWFIAPLAVPGSGDRGAYLFALTLTPLSLLGLWLCCPPH
jgi:hypothetical protein